MFVNISFLGGAYEVGASCILLNIYNKNILLDCGIRQGGSKDPLPDFRTIQDKGGIDAVIISHAHMDHIGSLPIMSKEYPDARIYTNNMTKDLMKVLLYDSLKIMNNREEEIPLYAEKDVVNMLDRIFTINYSTEFSIFENIKLTFYMAGHIAGASCVYITTPDGSLFYSGDFSIFSQKTVEGLKLPKLRPDAAIFETTYGDKLHSNRQVEEDKLIELVKECEINNSKMLIPAFALGRAQEVLLIIKKAINKKYVKNIKIYVDGMIKDINRVYKFNPLYLKNSLGKKILKGIEPFYDDNIIAIENNQMREKVLDSSGGCIIVSSSGMLTGGPSQYYAEKIAPIENAYIVITGYQDEESPGRKLLNLLNPDIEEKNIEINGRSIPVKCKVKNIGLSAHGDKNEIRSIIDLITPNNIFLVHGDPRAIDSFANDIVGEVRSRIYVPKSGETYEVNIRNPRKQWKKYFNSVLHFDERIDELNINRLWNFVLSNYGQKLFTVEELLHIWTGKDKFKDDDIVSLQYTIVNSIYFESDNKRLFLFKARSEDEVSELNKKKELKPNELNDFINEYFGVYKFKKAGLIYDSKKIILSFDFPYVVDEKIYDDINKFTEKTHWSVEVSDKVNINALDILIKKLLLEGDIKKISYKLNDKKALVIMNSVFNTDHNILCKFKNMTGMDIVIQNPGQNSKVQVEFLETSQNINVMEQNQALNYIDETFKKEEFKPYKKSIKNLQGNNYIELSFISPEVGKRYIEKLKCISQKTGWNISLSKSVNQNEIIKLALRFCDTEKIKLKKNPSYNPSEMTIEIKPLNGEDRIENFSSEFECMTGCKLVKDI
ncbi:MBL fold metallo-hydrolase [Clostridium fermenticellae]|uniref:MBL fold metallo-hydrolase n=1 Tax=Clostridium fermenticellae TaxID=2068654 RepID=A0A386H3R8_9CLOT|nr:MBL fold metallo-hydrolase [Clostridium fermenticellae]AYD40330.1 MBL fold metallo-hydrolase [Clostridium fermenticellae]